ncbi:unnamed protein product [Rotaria sordida]|uniref:FAD-binding FR-type domain-containing protein n=1 Tax=Rotaria sordida TaxID=392033 RepID=A0A819GSU2_9BILA|nr:unnamed protein product [Rotaria sordida]CAF3886676.1 unnamed protein product [Rotaria sordida]
MESPQQQHRLCTHTQSSNELDRAEHHLNELLNEPLCDHDFRTFTKHFDGDISKKNFTIEEFYKLFQLTKTFGERLLGILNESRCIEAKSISGENIIRIARILSMAPRLVKALILFKIFDHDDNKMITIQEISEFYEIYLVEFRFPHNELHRQELINTFLQNFRMINDNDNLNFDQFYSILQETPELFESLQLMNIPINDNDIKKLEWQAWRINNRYQILIGLLYILGTIGIIIHVIIKLIIHERQRKGWFIVARICGYLIKFNFALLIVLMLKQWMRWFRQYHCLRRFLPIDDHIDAHRYVGIIFAICSVVHSLAHTINYALNSEGYSFVQCMFTTSRQQGWVSGLTPITGNILLVFLIIMIIGALQCIRQREKCFILFRISHLLFWPIFILLVIHSEEFWKWACGPMFLFICEKLYLLKRYLPQKGRTHLKKVTIEDDNTISFTIVRPPYFNFNTGDYVNICFPRIVSYEWHPFTLSSCPENKDTLRIHISKRKNWTRKIYEHFNQQWKCQNEHFDVVTISTASITNNNIHSPSVNYPYTFNSNESIWIEGPYSSSTSYTFDCEHVVLIGAGIGITPYAGVLESLMYQFREQQNKCQHCHCINYDHEAIARRKLKKVDFIWVNRDVKNFSWFLQLLTDFENEQLTYLQTSTSENTVQQRYIDFHLYFTSLKRNDQGMIGNAPYDLVSNIYAKISNRDILTKLKTKTIVGRPQWPLLFAKLKAEYEKTNVFFTGSHSMGDEIRRLCDQYKFMYHHEPYF